MYIAAHAYGDATAAIAAMRATGHPQTSVTC